MQSERKIAVEVLTDKGKTYREFYPGEFDPSTMCKRYISQDEGEQGKCNKKGWHKDPSKICYFFDGCGAYINERTPYNPQNDTPQVE